MEKSSGTTLTIRLNAKEMEHLDAQIKGTPLSRGSFLKLAFLNATGHPGVNSERMIAIEVARTEAIAQTQELLRLLMDTPTPKRCNGYPLHYKRKSG